MNQDYLDEQQRLKILKFQEIRVNNLRDKNSKVIAQIDNTIDSSESLLKDLGYDISKLRKDFQEEKSSVKEEEKIISLRSWNEIALEAEKSIDFQVSFDDLLSQTEIKACISKIEFLRNEFEETNNANCDKYDYLIAATCGTIGGLIDIFFVGLPGQGALGKLTDNQANNLVEKFAEFSGWDREKAITKGSDQTRSAIGFLERKFKVNYDHAHGKAVDDLFKMSTKNHHLKSLAHSPSIIGLLVSILNQFTNTASFISDGKIITIDTKKFELQGSNLVSKIFSGFINWMGHILSDMCGSSGAIKRGSGVPIPFYELLQFLNVGSFGQHRQTFADVAVQVFEQGYDFRHGIAMSIPVIITEILTRTMWIIKHKFYHQKTWGASLKKSMPLAKNTNLKRMLFSAYGCFCLIDLTEAAMTSGGIAISMFAKMNLIAWLRFGKLGFEECCILLTKDDKKHKYVMSKLDPEWNLLNQNFNETIRLASGTYHFQE